MRNYIITIFLLFASSTIAPIWAQWSNHVNNIDLLGLGGGVHTWDIDGSDNGWIYFANGEGLFEYNSGQLSLYMPTDDIELRGVLACSAEGRIYISGVGEFGYYEVDERGSMLYTSLSIELAKQNPNIQLSNIWSIENIDNTIYLHEDHCVVKYVDNRFTIIKVDHKINTMSQVDGVLYLGTEAGMYMVIGNRAVKCRGSEILDNLTIREILPLRGSVGVVTQKAIYLYDSESVEIFDIGLNEFLCKNIAFCGAISERWLALGTIRGGVVIYDFERGEALFQNMNNGMQSNTVLSLYFEGDRLWIGQDGGVDYILLNSAFQTLDSSQMVLGSGYSAQLDGDNIYFGSNNGLYLHSATSGIELLAGAEGQVWSIESIWGDLFSLQDSGIFAVKGGEATRVGNVRGVLSAVEVAGREGYAIVGSYSSLYLIHRRDGEWVLDHQIEGCDRYPKRLIYGDDGELWLYDTNVIFRLRLDQDLREVISTESVLPPDGERIVSFDQVDGELIVSGRSGALYRIDSAGNSLVKVATLDQRISEVKRRGEHTFYIHKESIAVVDRDSAVRIVNLPVPINQRSAGIHFINDSMAILPHHHGFVLANLDASPIPTGDDEQVISSIRSTVPSDSLLYRANFEGLRAKLVIPHSMNSLRIESSQERYRGVSYQYRLSPKDQWSEPSQYAFKEFGNIGAGEHLISVRVIYSDDHVVEESIELRVLPAWYQSSVAYILYILLTIALLTMARIIALQRRKMREAALVAEKEAKIEILEKDMIEQQLRQKSQEMANLLVGAANRNELFSQIKEELSVVKYAIGNQSNEKIVEMIVGMNSKLDSNITSEEMLRRIEREFDVAHDNFMRELVSKHPNLNYNERMMCAYLHIGLSSKEIAPLLNISTRGVETVRYRIRKKFNLQRDDSLREYLSRC